MLGVMQTTPEPAHLHPLNGLCIGFYRIKIARQPGRSATIQTLGRQTSDPGPQTHFNPKPEAPSRELSIASSKPISPKTVNLAVQVPSTLAVHKGLKLEGLGACSLHIYTYICVYMCIYFCMCIYIYI